MIAFWKYDLFPYLLSGKVGEHKLIGKPDLVNIPSYGPGMWVKPVHLFSDEIGKIKQMELEKIVTEHNEKLARLKNKSYKKIFKLFTHFDYGN